MNNISYLIECIKRSIPKEILQFTFCPSAIMGRLNYSLDYMIQNEIMENWVLRDCNIIGGREVTIDLSCASFELAANGYLIKVPVSALGGREITSVLSISYGMSGYFDSRGHNEIVDALSTPLKSTDARIQLVGPNTIFMESRTISGRLFLRCVLDNDKDLGNISPRALVVLEEMAVNACKAFIYTNQTIRVAESAIIAGVSIDKFASIIDEYADAMELYKEHRKVWRKVSLMQDRVTQNRNIRIITPS